MSRPTACTPVLTKRVCEVLRQGHYRCVAASAAGMDIATFKRWMNEDREPYRAFRAAVVEAEREAEEKLFGRVLAEALDPDGDAKLALEVLARKFPARYGRRDQTKHDVAVTDVTGTEDPKTRLAKLRSVVAALESATEESDGRAD